MARPGDTGQKQQRERGMEGLEPPASVPLGLYLGPPGIRTAGRGWWGAWGC